MAALFERSVLGLDVGTHGLKAVELKVSPRSLAPGQFRVQPRTSGLDDDAPSIKESLERFVALHSLPTAQVAAAMPARQLSTRQLDFPFSDPRRLSQAIPFEIEAETPFDLDEIVVDWNLLSGDRHQGVVSATLAKRSQVSEVLGTLRDAKCEPQVIEAEGLVLGNLAPIFRLEGTQVIADIGHEKTTFCAVVDGRPTLARSIPVAGRAMTEALMSELGLTFEDAEEEKTEGSVLGRPGGGASPGVMTLVDRIAREAIRTLEAAEARRPEGSDVEPATLTLVGGGARLDRIDEVLARRTSLPTHRLRMPADSPHADLVKDVDPVLFGPALALALRLTAESVTRMNFRQGDLAYRQDFRDYFARELRPTAALAALCLGLLLVSTVVTVFLQHRRADRNETAAVALYNDAFPERDDKPGNPSKILRSELSSAEDRAEFLGLYSGNRSALALLAELSSAIPSDLDVRVTEVHIDRNLIRLDVDAQRFEAADRLTSVLSETSPFEGAEIAGSVKTDRNSGGVSFNVNIPLALPGGEA